MAAPHNYVIPTEDLAAVLTPLVKQLDRSLEPDNRARNSPHQGRGAHKILGERIANRFQVTPDAILRRIYGIFSQETLSTGSELADALLLELGVQIGDTDLPTFAGTLFGALDMVESWADFNDPAMTRMERKRLAKTLFSFSRAYLKAAAPDHTLAYIEQEAEKKKNRNREPVAA